MSKRSRLLLVEDMPEFSLTMKKYTEGLAFDMFLNDEKTIDAVARNFEIIGEAANRLDQYFGVDYEIVWTIIEDDVKSYI